MTTKKDVVKYIRENGTVSLTELAKALGKTKEVTIIDHDFKILIWEMLADHEITLTDDRNLSTI